MNKELLISFLKNNAVIYFDPQNEDTPVRGNALASGDDAIDNECEDKIIERLNQGDLSAWFCAKVTAECFGFKESAYLGACCYNSFEEFQSDDYYKDMVSEAIEQLADALIRKQSVLKTLAETIGE